MGKLSAWSIVLCLAPMLVHAQASGWLADPKSGCRVWAGRIGAGAGFTWTGSCVEGFASGQGTLTWANGNRYQGELRDGKPNGPGTLTRPDGQVFRGTWNNGCYRQGNRWSAVMVTAEECGFR